MSNMYAEVDALIEKATLTMQGRGDGAIVELCEKILCLLAALGLVLWNVRLKPLSVGVHFDNRDGLGIKADYMVKLAAKIFRSGFRWNACTDAICCEDDDLGRIADFTINLQSRSSSLGQQTRREIQYGSLACSHLNQWLVAGLCSAENDEKSMTVDGRLCLDKLRGKQPEIAKALDQGLLWTIIKAEAIKRWPILTKLVQKARQIAGQIHNGETHFELLVNIQALSKEMADPQTGAIDWAAVQKAASVSEHRYIDDIPYLCTIIQLYGGGREGQFIKAFAAFATAAVPDNRRIPGPVWKAISQLKVETSKMAPFVIWAMLKTEALCPHEFVTNGVTGFIKCTEISSVASKGIASMINANNLMKQYHEIADRVNIDTRTRVKIIDKADILITQLILGKDVARVKTVEQVAGEAMQSMIATFPELALVENPWESNLVVDNVDSKTAAGPSSSGLVEHGTAGSNAPRLACAHAGITVGQTVAILDHPDQWFKIIDMQEEVRLRQVSSVTGQFVDKKVIVVDYGSLTARYKVMQQVQVLKGYPGNTIIGSSQLRSSVLKSHCLIFLNSLVHEHGEPKVEVREKPSRGVFAKEAHKVRTMIVVPATTAIFEIDDQKEAFFVCGSGNKRYSIMTPDKHVVSIAFHIRSSDKSDECNCALVKKRSESGVYPSIVECTVINNTKKIAAGDELVVYRERVKTVVVKKHMVAVENQASKKAKHA